MLARVRLSGCLHGLDHLFDRWFCPPTHQEIPYLALNYGFSRGSLDRRDGMECVDELLRYRNRQIGKTGMISQKFLYRDIQGVSEAPNGLAAWFADFPSTKHSEVTLGEAGRLSQGIGGDVKFVHDPRELAPQGIARNRGKSRHFRGLAVSLRHLYQCGKLHAWDSLPRKYRDLDQTHREMLGEGYRH